MQIANNRPARTFPPHAGQHARLRQIASLSPALPAFAGAERALQGSAEPFLLESQPGRGKPSHWHPPRSLRHRTASLRAAIHVSQPKRSRIAGQGRTTAAAH
jgi:hypothetical protein